MSTTTEPVAELEAQATKEVSAWARQIKRRIVAGETAIGVVTTEPADATRAITNSAIDFRLNGDDPLHVITWDCVEGFKSATIIDGALENEIARLEVPPSPNNPDGIGPKGCTRTPLCALKAVTRCRLGRSGEDSAIFIFYNMYGLFADPTLLQQFENMVKSNQLSEARNDARGQRRAFRRPLILIQSPFDQLGLKGITTIGHWIVDAPFPLPTADELRTTLGTVVRDLQLSPQNRDPEKAHNFDETHLRNVAVAARGLTRTAALNEFYHATSVCGGLNAKVAATIRAATAARLAKGGMLEVVDEADITHVEQLGGISAAVTAIERAARTFTDAAKAEHLDHASGAWLAGLPGSGKSEFCKASSRIFARITGRAFTVLKVRTGAIFGGLVGQTQGNWYSLERMITAFGDDTIVWFDEVDKVFGGVESSSGDSGIRKDLFGLMLGWLSDRKRRSYVMMALNNPEGIPGELFRRLNVGFFFDTPGPKARREILKIHFGKRLTASGRKLADLGFKNDEWAQLSRLTINWMPSELEQAVKDSRDLAFERSGSAMPSLDDVLNAIEAMRGMTLIAQKEDQIEALRKACSAARRVDDEPRESGKATKKPTKDNSARGMVFDDDN